VTGAESFARPAQMSTIADQSLVRTQYADATRLQARQAIWGQAPSLVDTVLDLASPKPLDTVLDVGCGNGLYLSALAGRGHVGRRLALDLSAVMAAGCRPFADPVRADVQALPLRTGVVDVAACMHMLYHVPDLDRAVAELRRVVRPGGAAVVTTNGPGHMAELVRLFATAAEQVTGRSGREGWNLDRFGPLVARQHLGALFDEVRLHDLGRPVPVDDPAIVHQAIASLPPESVGVTAGPVWSAVLAVASELVADQFARHRRFIVTTAAAALVCR
jgi:SAM-dependent methyltransferase